jgi:Putative undecaprenyl diphosphate synthase
MGATYQWLWEYIPIVLSKTKLPSFPPLQSGLKRLENSCIAAIRRGPVPQHIAIIMDGNRRYARSHRIDTAEGHYSGAESLKNVIHFCAVHLIVRFWKPAFELESKLLQSMPFPSRISSEANMKSTFSWI